MKKFIQLSDLSLLIEFSGLVNKIPRYTRLSLRENALIKRVNKLLSSEMKIIIIRMKIILIPEKTKTLALEFQKHSTTLSNESLKFKDLDGKDIF